MPPPSSKRHIQNDLLSSPPDLSDGQTVARVIKPLGENLYEVETPNTNACALYKLPKRLRHVAFIKRGSYVFVRDDASRGSSRVRGDIETVVLDKFLDVLRKEAFWPEQFARRVEKTDDVKDQGGLEVGEEGQGEEGDEDEEDWEIGMGNPNRRKWDHVSSDEESE